MQLTCLAVVLAVCVPLSHFGCALLRKVRAKSRTDWYLILAHRGIRHDLDDLSEKSKGLVEFGLRTTCRGGGMADAADLKSVVRKDVRVRLPPSAPQAQSNCSICVTSSQ